MEANHTCPVCAVGRTLTQVAHSALRRAGAFVKARAPSLECHASAALPIPGRRPLRAELDAGFFVGGILCNIKYFVTRTAPRCEASPLQKRADLSAESDAGGLSDANQADLSEDA